MTRLSLFTILFWVLLPVPPAAADPGSESKDDKWQAQLFIENDMLARTDRYYTNGLKLGIGKAFDSAPGIADLKKRLQRLLHGLSEVGAESGSGTGATERSSLETETRLQDTPKTDAGLFIGQNMYTPRNIRIAENQPGDRPWAAWLYLGIVAQQVKEERLDTVELDIGVVGPLAKGGELQSAWHEIIGSPTPQGWANQIPNEPAFLLAYLQKRRYGNDNIQFVPHVGATIGTVMTLARAGGIVRVGQEMNDFGVDSVEPGGTMLQSIRGHGGFSWYVFAGGDYRWVARNIFLDGTLFRDSTRVDRHNTVHDLTAGLALRHGKFNLTYARIWRSEEFTTEKGGGGSQTFDSLNVGFDWY